MNPESTMVRLFRRIVMGAMAASILVLVAVSASSAVEGHSGSHPGAKAASLPTFGSTCMRHAVRPRSIMLACADGGAALTHIHWSSWTAKRAAGTGVLAVNDCTPDCADGHFVNQRVRITADHPRHCSGSGLRYLRLRWSVIGSSATARYPSPSALTCAETTQPVT